MNPMISFVIPVRNAATTLGRCVRSIAANDYPRDRFEIVVADNGSTDASVSIALAAGATVLHLPGLRASDLRNRAAKAAGGEVLAFIDADHEIHPHWARTAVDTLYEPGVGGVGAPYHSPRPGTWVQRQYDALRGHAGDRHDVEWLGSGNLAVWREAFESLGGFDIRLETCEDVDFCARLRKCGHRLVSDPRLYSTHFGDPRTLRELFTSELWRGRDNARVTLRSPRSWRSLASLMVPALDLTMLVLSLLALSILGRSAVGAVGTAALGVLTLAGIRAWSKIDKSSLSSAAVFQVLIVAAVYDLGRAFALIARAGHDIRRKAAAEPL